MGIFKKIGASGLILFICLALACAVTLPILTANVDDFALETLPTYPENIPMLLSWIIFWFVVFFLLANVLFSHKIFVGKMQEVFFFLCASALISLSIAVIIFAFLESDGNLEAMYWYGLLDKICTFKDFTYYGIAILFFIGFVCFYAFVIDRRILNFTRSSLRGSGKLKQIETNLENSRWMNGAEKQKNFKSYKYSELSKIKKDGIPVAAKLIKKGKDMDVSFQSPCHALVIGSTGSGKTTTFVSPMIQLIGATAAGSSMIVTDPKGELFSMHSKFLKKRGYDVKVIDLRDTYASYRWNPLDCIWDTYQEYLFGQNSAVLRKGPVDTDEFALADDISTFPENGKWYGFKGKAYSDYNHMIEAIKVYKKKMFDEVYEDINDLVSVLIPVENPKDPMWEKGARSIVLATLLAMLEDSANPDLGMTKEKFNFFNMTKILQNSSNDYKELRNYFAGRSVLSKAYSLSKQVCDCAETTRASYMSIVYEKLTMFNDAGICALTSASDFTSEQLAYKPTALFLKIPDEKDTRHNLAAIFILNIYKTLIKVASAKESLSLDRNVFFIMDEFGNMPKIEKFDKFITVGRSRKIWFTMIIQSYAQLNNVYGDTVADIVKGNCGIKMFIGSNDMNTCKEYSELCGNITVVTTSTSGSTSGNDVNISSQTQTRPLIYPSELQRLNHPGDIGHSIIVTFGNYPLKTYFTPQFNVPLYQIGKMDTSDTDRFFDENGIFYDMPARNKKIIDKMNGGEQKKPEPVATEQKEEKKVKKPKKSDKKDAEQTQLDAEMKQLLDQFQYFKKQNGEATLNDFYREMLAEKKGEA